MCFPWIMSLTLARVPPQAMQVVTLPFCISIPDLPKCDASKQICPWNEEFKLETAAAGSIRKNEELRPVLPDALLCCGTLALLQQHTLAACPVAKIVAIVPFYYHTLPHTLLLVLSTCPMQRNNQPCTNTKKPILSAENPKSLQISSKSSRNRLNFWKILPKSRIDATKRNAKRHSRRSNASNSGGGRTRARTWNGRRRGRNRARMRSLEAP